MKLTTAPFRRFSRFVVGRKGRLPLIRETLHGSLWQGWLWLTVPRDPVDWKAVLASAGLWLHLRTIASRVIAGVILVGLLVAILRRVERAFAWFRTASPTDIHKISPLFAPLASVVGTLATLAVGVFLALAALKQARMSTELARAAAQQAETASKRHGEQTKSDFNRRITESFIQATESCCWMRGRQWSRTNRLRCGGRSRVCEVRNVT
jgi:hypothetical protein